MRKAAFDPKRTLAHFTSTPRQITAEGLEHLTILNRQRSFHRDGRLLRLGLQAYALGIAYEFDPYFGLSISRVDPLPHQLEAVFEVWLSVS